MSAMINLSAWCNPDDVKPYYHQPFNCSERTVATDGKVMIAVPLQKKYKNFEQYKSFIDEFLAKSDGFKPLDYTLPVPEKEDCDRCQGTGQLKKIGCPECDGDGEVSFDTAYNFYECECKKCEGSGEIQGKGDCHYCDASGKKYPKLAHVLVDRVPIQPDYYKLLISVGEGLEVSGDPAKMMLHFRNAGSQGVLMGFRV